MVSTEQVAIAGSLFKGLSESGHLKAYAWLFFIIIVATVLMTLFDRRFDKDFPTRWREGIAESFYSVMSVATSGRPPSRKNLFGWVGRIWQALWLVCGVAVLAYVTSSVTSVKIGRASCRESVGVWVGGGGGHHHERAGPEVGSGRQRDAALCQRRRDLQG